MVLEQLIKTKWAEKKNIYSIFLGIFFTLIAFITSNILFKNAPSFIGVATLFFVVVISIPSIRKLFESEEMIEVRGKKQPFLKEHEAIIDFYIYFFIGIFVTLFVIALFVPSLVFSEAQLYGGATEEISVNSIAQGLPPPPTPSAKLAGIELSFLNPEMYLIFKNNFYIMLIAFALSLFYGSGALFLIVLNASIFASALASTIRIKLPELGFLFKLTFISCNMGIMFLHMIPEVSSYLLAAIAGGVLSKAFVKEKFWSKEFKTVLKDSLILLVSAFIVLVVAAIIEIMISKSLFTSDICINYKYVVLISITVIILGLIIFEIFRKRKNIYISIHKKIK